MTSISAIKIPVEEGLLRELNSLYSEYLQAISHPFDPVAVLRLNGQVLATVKRILASLDHPSQLQPESPSPPV